jgi:hypothetical protein
MDHELILLNIRADALFLMCERTHVYVRPWDVSACLGTVSQHYLLVILSQVSPQFCSFTPVMAVNS